MSRTLERYCAALNRRDYKAVRALFTADSAIRQQPAATGDPQHRRHWTVTKVTMSGLDVPGFATGWVTFHYVSAQKTDTGYSSYELFERQPDGSWLFFAPPLPQ